LRLNFSRTVYDPRVKNGSDDLHNQDFAPQLTVAHR
jgi:hypothetical protein